MDAKLRVMKLSRDELCFVARIKGWKRGNASKQAMIDWFLTSGRMTPEEILQIVRDAKKPGAATPAAAPTFDRAAVERIVDEKLRTATIDVESGVVQKLIAEAVAKAHPQKIVVDSAEPTKGVMIERPHAVFEKVLKLATRGVNVLLVGPAACGKTTLGHHLAKALKRKFGMLPCTSGASEAQLTGWLLPVGGKAGEFSYVPSEFVRLYEEGNAVFLFDEFDAADPNMLLVINSALANGSLHVPQRFKQPLVERGKNVTMIAAANTFGSGSDMMYAGRNQLDAATLDRFYVIEMDYDRELERFISGNDEEVLAWVWALRDKVKQHRVRRVVSTRTIQRMVAAKKVGYTFDAIRRDVLNGWSKDELTKVGEVL